MSNPTVSLHSTLKHTIINLPLAKAQAHSAHRQVACSARSYWDTTFEELAAAAAAWVAEWASIAESGRAGSWELDFRGVPSLDPAEYGLDTVVELVLRAAEAW